MKKMLVLMALGLLACAAIATAQSVPSVPLKPRATPTPTPTATPAAPPPRTPAVPVPPATPPGQVGQPALPPAPAFGKSAMRRPAEPVPQPGVPQPSGRTLPTEIKTTQPTPPTEMRATQTPASEANVQISAKLERIRIQRSRTFAAGRAAAPDAAVEAEWGNELTLQVNLAPSRDWDVLEVSEAAVRQAQDQNGQPLPLVKSLGAPNPTSAAPNLNPPEVEWHRAGNGATVMLRAVPPPAGVRGFKELSAGIRATVGLRRTIKVNDVRAKIGASIMRDTGLSDVVLQVTDVTEDGIDLSALGEVRRIGEVTFTDAAGKALEPFNVEAQVRETPPGTSAKESKDWHFFFTKLPAGRINMSFTVYPVIAQRSLAVTFPEFTLP